MATTQTSETQTTTDPAEQSSAPVVEDQGIQDTTAETVQEPNVALVAEEPAVQVSEEPAVSEFQAKIDELKAKGTPAQKILIASLEKYIDSMAPGKVISNDQGARQQYNLWKAIGYVVNDVPVEEVKRLWNLLLAIFEEHKNGVFHDRYVFRFSEYWVWSQHELNGLHRVLNLIKLTSDPATRAKGLLQVDLDRSLAEGFSDDARQKIITFYKG